LSLLSARRCVTKQFTLPLIFFSFATHNSSTHISNVLSHVSGCVVLGLVQVGFFLAGAAAGAAIAFMLFSVIGNYFGDHSNLVRLGLLGFFALFGGVMVVKQEKSLISLITSIVGAYMAIAGADHFVKSGYVQAINSIFTKDENVLPSASFHLLLMLGATVVLAFFGFVFQFFTNRNKNPVTGWEENQYLLRKSVNY